MLGAAFFVIACGVHCYRRSLQDHRLKEKSCGSDFKTPHVSLVSLDAKVNSIAEILHVLRRDGGVIVLNMLSQEVLEGLRADLVPTAKKVAPGRKSDDAAVLEFCGVKTKRFTRLAWRSKTFADNVLVHPVLRAVADAELLDNCKSYWMNTGQMMIIGPGERSQGLHRDADNWKFVFNKEKEVTISCMFAISDFTAETGATRVVPGSHLWSDFDATVSEDQVCQAVMPAGSGMIYSGNVLHGGGNNVTAETWRMGMHLSYVLGWLCPEEAGCLGVPEATAKEMTPLQQQLLGYRCYAGDTAGARLWTIDYEDVPTGLNWT